MATGPRGFHNLADFPILKGNWGRTNGITLSVEQQPNAPNLVLSYLF